MILGCCSGCEGSSDLVETSVASDDSQAAFSHTLPIFRKIEGLSNKLQVYNLWRIQFYLRFFFHRLCLTVITCLQIIREEHARLSNEVKGISIDSLIGSEAFTALQNLSASPFSIVSCLLWEVFTYN